MKFIAKRRKSNAKMIIAIKWKNIDIKKNNLVSLSLFGLKCLGAGRKKM